MSFPRTLRMMFPFNPFKLFCSAYSKSILLRVPFMLFNFVSFSDFHHISTFQENHKNRMIACLHNRNVCSVVSVLFRIIRIDWYSRKKFEFKSILHLFFLKSDSITIELNEKNSERVFSHFDFLFHEKKSRLSLWEKKKDSITKK